MANKVFEKELDGGKTVWLTLFAEGGKAFEDSACTKAFPDGEHLLEQGSLALVVKEGKVIDIKDVPHGIEDSEFQRLKKVYGKLRSISVYDEDGKRLTVWFKKPDMPLMEATLDTEMKPLDESKLIYNTLIVGGNQKEVEADPELLMAVYLRAQTLIHVQEADLKKW